MELTPDLEAAAVTRLDSLDVPVATKVPHPRPDTFIRVQLASAARRDIVFVDATLTVEAWAGTSVAAFDLAARAEALLITWPGTPGIPVIYDVGSEGVVNFPDESMSSRYLFTARVVARVRHT